MNTDDCNVEDINTPHITECLSLPFVASFEDCFCLFRTWSSPCARMIWILTTFLILLRCKNSFYRFQQWICPCAVRIQQVALLYLPSIHQISTLEKTNSCQHSTLSNLMSKRPSQVSLFLDAAHSTSSDVNDFHIWFSPAFWCSRRQRGGSPFTASRDQIHHWSRFCCDSFFTWIFLRSFRHYFRTICGTEMADAKQTQKMIRYITCEVSLGQYACELVLSINVFIWILGSNLIRSYNESRATVWFWKHVSLSGFFPLWSS